MLVQAGLCGTCSETTLLVFPRGGSYIYFWFVDMAFNIVCWFVDTVLKIVKKVLNVDDIAEEVQKLSKYFI